MTTQSSVESADSKSLRRNRLGIAGIVFFVVAASAPLVGMTGAVPVAIVLGNGAAAPGAYLLAGIVLLLFSVGYAAMSQKVTNAGAFFAYVGRGLGRNTGIASAFVSIVAYVGIQLAIYGFFGGLVAGQMAALGLDLPWWVWTIAAWAIVTLLALLSVDVGAKVLGVLLILELASLLIVAIAVFAAGGANGLDFAASFAPANILAGGFAGGAGIALAFAFASFVGFEATAIYGEESKDPKRTVPRATYWAVGIITGLFAVVAFAMVSAFGAEDIVIQTVERTEGLTNPAGLLFAASDTYVGPWLTTIMSWLVVSSLFAGLLAFQNATSRYFFALGRGGVLGSVFGTTNKAGAPQAGVMLTSAIALLVMVLFAVFNLDPVLNMFFWFSAVAVIAIVLVEILVSVAIIAFFRREGGASLWTGMIAPALAAIGLVLAQYLLMSRFNLLAGTVPDGVDPSLPESAWALNGLGWFLVLLPFIALVVGFIIAAVRKSSETSEITEDILS